MTAFKYDNYREEAGAGTMLWTGMNVKLAFVDISYVPDSDHVYLSEVTGILAVSDSFFNLGITAGFATGVCPEFKLLRLGPEIAGALLFDDTGNPSTSKLIVFSNDGPAFPFTAIGFDYTVAYNAAEGGWFRI